MTPQCELTQGKDYSQKREMYVCGNILQMKIQSKGIDKILKKGYNKNTTISILS
jgi:hypothetical protein